MILPKDIQRIIGEYVHRDKFKKVKRELWVATFMIRVGFTTCHNINYPVMSTTQEGKYMISYKPIYSPFNWNYKYQRCKRCKAWKITESEFRDNPSCCNELLGNRWQ